MGILSYVFALVAAYLGATLLVVAALAGSAWTTIGVLKYLKVWHVTCLALSIRMHGKHYAENQFWWAIKEASKKSATSARIISDYALSHAPKDHTHD